MLRVLGTYIVVPDVASRNAKTASNPFSLTAIERIWLGYLIGVILGRCAQYRHVYMLCHLTQAAVRGG